MHSPDDLRYHPEHTWVRIEDDGAATVGITDYAQDELGDVVYVDLPEIGKVVTTGEAFGSVESAKTISDLISPLDGEVVEVNSALEDSPEVLNGDPYGDGWVVRLRPSPRFATSDLMKADEYEDLIAKG